MKTTFLTTCLLLISLGLFAQNWRSQESGVSEMLAEITFKDQDTAFAVGLNGTYIKTVNGGETWESVYLYTDVHFYCITFASPAIGYITGASTVLKTTDYGKSWEFLPNPPQGGYYYDCHFLNDTVGFISANDGLLMKTIDGGRNWQILPTGTEENLYTIQFLTDSIGYVTGHPGILKTIDAGNSWEFLDHQFEEQLMYSHFSADGTAYALGLNGFAAKSIDNGANWEQFFFPGEVTGNLYEITFASQLEYYVIGQNGLIYRSIDKGLNWAVDSTYTTVILRDMQQVGDRLFVVGGEGKILYKDLNNSGIEINQTSELLLYPNPASNHLYVKGAEIQSRFAVYTITGQQLKSGILTDSSIDLTRLTPGNYIIAVQSGKQTIQQIIIRQ